MGALMKTAKKKKKQQQRTNRNRRMCGLNSTRYAYSYMNVNGIGIGIVSKRNHTIFTRSLASAGIYVNQFNREQCQRE